MSPSKENCRKALEIADRAAQLEDVGVTDLEFVHNFLQAAEKRLPTQKSLDADKNRTRVRKAKA